MSTRWDEPAAAPAAVAYQIDCRTMDSDVGDRVLSDAAHSYYSTPRHMILNAAGEDAFVVAYDHLGCVLAGPPPYRLLSWVISAYDVDPDAYSVAVRSPNPGDDCPRIEPLPFGVAPADRFPGVGCRQFDADEGATYGLRAVQASGPRRGEAYWTRVVNEQGLLTCNLDPPGGPLLSVAVPGPSSRSVRRRLRCSGR